ncbi:hypothetical protein B2G71_05720 [Novosphingobium sp. PC22D]|uniref:hypothetical protein n=1 Tax=Novosphingobium sp. PC22D TaxID=1962403 RepID=UPI000BF1E17D|nr:hypothetical protein [Novosphingobium sp. PC22D]PEQ13807.1 hypothetical protein B2G71_05720 [Novosphingobium sp. PC22D]
MSDKFKKLSPIFVATVVVPTLLAVLYFGFFASDVYISQSHFVVRSPTKPSPSGLGAILTGGALGGAGEETNAVVEYLGSRAALRDANANGLVREAYGPAHASWFDRFGGMLSGTSDEQLYKYFMDKLEVDHDATEQVTSLTVRAYTAKDAQAINERLLERSEALVNRLSNRARGDAIEVANAEVDRAKAHVRETAAKLARYRNEAGVIDPEKEAGVRLQMISKLQDELIASRTQLRQMRTYTPDASQIPFLKTQVSSLEREIAEQTRGVAGGNRSLSARAVRYQELALDSELAQKQLAAVLASREEAEAEARRKRAYVERIADPNLPDYPLEPRRLRGIIATFVLGLLAWGVISTLIVGVREHRD